MDEKTTSQQPATISPFATSLGTSSNIPHEEPTPAAIEQILMEIRPAIQMDGGDIELVAVLPADGEVHIRMAGACIGCPASTMTLKMGIEQAIQERFPDLEVIPVP